MRPFFRGGAQAPLSAWAAARTDMPGHLHAAPLLAQYAVPVDQEGAAVDAHVFLAVELLQLDHVEQLADRFILVADQFEGEFLFALEVLVGLQAVAGDAEDLGIGLLERRVLVAEALALGGATGGAVLRVEVQDDLLALQRGQGHLLAAGCGGGEVGYGFVDCDRHGSAPQGCWGRQGSIRASRFRASAKSRNWSRSQLIWVPAGSVTVIVALSMVVLVCGAW